MSEPTAEAAYRQGTVRRVYRIYPWARSKWRARFIAMKCLVSEHRGGVFVVDVTADQEDWIDVRLVAQR